MKEDLPFEIKKLYERWEKDKSSKIFAALANALRKIGLYDEALKILNEGILRNPDYAEGYIVLGRINIERGNISEGIEALKKAVEFDPYNAVAVRLLAECFENIGDLKSSLEYYKKLKNIDPFFENIDKKIEEIEKKLEIPEKKVEEISVVEEKIIEKEEEKILEEVPLPPELEEIVIEKEEEEKGIIFEEFGKEEVPPFLTEEKVSILDELEKEETIYEEEKVIKEEKIEISEIEKAKIFEEKGFLEKALEIYKGILEKEPDNEEIKNKIKEIEDKLKIKEESKEEISSPHIPEEAIKIFEEIEEFPPIEEIFEEKEVETEKKIEYEEIPSVEEIVEEKEIKYSPHPFKAEEEYVPFYEFKGEEIKIEEEKISPEVDELLKKMEEEKKKEEEKREKIKEEIEKEEKIKDEEGFRTFLDWIEKLKK